MEILRITVETASAASHIYALSWKTAYRGMLPDSYLDQLSLERWTPLLQNSSYEGYLLREGGGFVATCSVAPARDPGMPGWGEIISLYVLPEQFGRGYGTALFDFAQRRLQEMCYRRFYLWVLEQNFRARRFYQRNGFSFCGDRAALYIGGGSFAELRYTKEQ